MFDKIKSYFGGLVTDVDTYIGLIAALVILFILPAQFIKIAALGLCGFLFFKPNYIQLVKKEFDK